MMLKLSYIGNHAFQNFQVNQKMIFLKISKYNKRTFLISSALLFLKKGIMKIKIMDVCKHYEKMDQKDTLVLFVKMVK